MSAKVGLDHFVLFLAVISISLGVLNLLPIPVLDGGHLLYYIIEAIKGGPLSEKAMLAARYARYPPDGRRSVGAGQATSIWGVNGINYRVDGVMPQGFQCPTNDVLTGGQTLPKPVELWVPLAISDKDWLVRRLDRKSRRLEDAFFDVLREQDPLKETAKTAASSEAIKK